MTSRIKSEAKSIEIWDQLREQMQIEDRDRLSPDEAKTVWDHGAEFIALKADAMEMLVLLTRTFNEQIRTRPHELELKQLKFELHRVEITAPGANLSYAQEQQKWQAAFSTLERIGQRYRELSADWLPTPIPKSEPPISKRELVRLLTQMGWKGDPDAYLRQANKDPEIQACQNKAGRGWFVSKVIDLGIRRGKLEPKIHRAPAALGNWPFAPR